MEGACGKPCPKELRPGLERSAVQNLPLQPDLVEGGTAPIGENADAVSAGGKLVEMTFQPGEGQTFVNILLHLEAWTDLQGKLCNNAEPAQGDNCPVEYFTVCLAGEGEQLALRSYYLHGRDNCCEIPQAV